MHAPWTHLDPLPPPTNSRISTTINTALAEPLGSRTPATPRHPNYTKQTAARAASGATQWPREEDAHVGFEGVDLYFGVPAVSLKPSATG